MTLARSLLQHIRLESINSQDGYVQLVFANAAVLNIYNKYEIVGVGPPDIGQLRGQIVMQVDENADVFSLRFPDNVAILVSLRDEDFVGPEAMYLATEDGQHVVWN